MTLSAKTRNQKKLDPKYTKFKSKNQQIRVVNKKDGVIKVIQNPNPKRGMIEDIDGGQREKVVESKPRTKPDDLVMAGKQDDDKPRGIYSRRTLAFLARHGLKDVGMQDDFDENENDSDKTPQWLSRKRRALKREARDKKRGQAQDRENRAERRALRLAREWDQKREQEIEHQKVMLDYYQKHMEEQKDKSDRTSVEKNITTLIEKSREVRVLIQDLKLSQSEPPEDTATLVQEEDDNPSTEIREKQLSPVQEEDSSESENEEREAEDREKMPPPKAKSSTEKSEKELRMEAREKRREEEERKQEEEYWPVWDEIPKEKKKRKRTCDRIVFKKSDYNMTDSDESSYEEEEEESRYAPARTSAPSPKQAPSSKPAKFIPLWAQGELLEQALEKQSDPSSFDLDALFFLVPTPDMKLMFPKKKKNWRRTSSAIWLAPPPASFRVHSAA